MEDTIIAIAMIKLTFPQNDSNSFRLPAQQHAPMTHRGGQNLCSWISDHERLHPCTTYHPNKKKMAARGNFLLSSICLRIIRGVTLSVVDG